MRLEGLTIDRERLSRVLTRAGATAARAHADSPRNAGGRRRGSVVSDAVLAETLALYEECRCEEMGLHAGMPASELINLGEGCTEPGDGTGWVCERLNIVRKRYGY